MVDMLQSRDKCGEPLDDRNPEQGERKDKCSR